MMNDCTNAGKIELCVTRKELAEILHCGLYTADRIAKEAEARIIIGKRVLINMEKVRLYVKDNSI